MNRPYLDLIPRYFPELSGRQLDLFGQLWDVYHHWNAQINVISRKDIDELYLRHVLHSLAIAKAYKFQSGTEVLDVGTGGGFPGIPLSIYFENVQFTLVDSIGKKIKVVNEVLKVLDIHNATGLQARAEQLPGRYDVVVSRAVTDLATFMSWVADKIRKGDQSGIGNGIVYLKGGDLEAELKGVRWKSTTLEISGMFAEPFFETKKVVHLVKP
ncbi:MAG: 16S rRNA (guanine(527)-N(7))-methyltransferase RsmG [Cyclobacteriaceae bacterium]|nr:16S rRNA (guanine(527)-N(7))-methyltransferase RsmG [Cyclobacteriaceae bacterium]